MLCRIEVNKWGGFFNVPWQVADKFLRISDGDFVKVLLGALTSGSPQLDTKELAHRAGVDEQRAQDALLYWSSLGVISMEEHEGNTGGEMSSTVKPAASAASVRNYAPSGEGETVKPTEKHVMTETAEKKTVVRYTPSELAQLARSNEEVYVLFQSAEQALGRTISATEQAGFVDIYEYYSMPAASIILLTRFCAGLGKGNMAYIRSVAKDWYERGILDPHDAEKEIIRLTEYYSYEGAVKAGLGLKAKTTKSQKAFFERWKELGISPELAELAGEISIENTDKHTVNLSYMDKVLAAWKQQGITTPAQAKSRQSDSGWAGSKASDKQQRSPKSYSIEEFESFIRGGYQPSLTAAQSNDEG